MLQRDRNDSEILTLCSFAVIIIKVKALRVYEQLCKNFSELTNVFTEVFFLLTRT